MQHTICRTCCGFGAADSHTPKMRRVRSVTESAGTVAAAESLVAGGTASMGEGGGEGEGVRFGGGELAPTLPSARRADLGLRPRFAGTGAA
jgi:hypothetical protein